MDSMSFGLLVLENNGEKKNQLVAWLIGGVKTTQVLVS